MLRQRWLRYVKVYPGLGAHRLTLLKAGVKLPPVLSKPFAHASSKLSESFSFWLVADMCPEKKGSGTLC